MHPTRSSTTDIGRQALTLELVSGNAARMIPRWSSSCRSSRSPLAAILRVHARVGMKGYTKLCGTNECRAGKAVSLRSRTSLASVGGNSAGFACRSTHARHSRRKTRGANGSTAWRSLFWRVTKKKEILLSSCFFWLPTLPSSLPLLSLLLLTNLGWYMYLQHPDSRGTPRNPKTQHR